MTEELKPCPFCGAPAVLKQNSGNENYNMSFWIACTRCGVTGGSVEGPSPYGFNPQWAKRDVPEAKAMAAEAWNRRATPAPAQPEDSRQALEAAALAIERKASKSLERFDFDRAWSAGMRKAAEIVRGLAAQPEGQKTGWPPGMLQDDDRKLSRALADTPHARANADEAAAAIKEMERIRFAAPTSPTPDK